MANDVFGQLFPEAAGQAAPEATSTPAGSDTTQQDGVYSKLFPEAASGAAAPKQSTFMDMVDSFNNTTRKFADGQLEGFFKGMSALGVDTSGAQQKLEADSKMSQQYADMAAQNSPVSSAIASGVAQVGNIVRAGSELGGYGLASPAPSVAGRLLQSATLSGAEGAAEKGGLEERALKGGEGFLLGAAGQGIGEGIGAAAGKLFSRPVQDAANEINAGLKPTVGQATGNPTIQAAEGALAQVPLWGAKAGVQRAATGIEDSAKGVLDKALVGQQSSADLANALKSDFSSVVNNAATKTANAYQAATDIAEKNNIPINLASTKKTASDALNSIKGLKDEGVSSADINASGPVGDLFATLASKDAMSAQNFQALRAKVKDLAGTSNNKDLEAIKTALNNDFEQTATNSTNPEFSTAAQTAKDTYNTLKAPIKNDPLLQKVSTEGFNTDKILNDALSNKAPNTTKTLVNSLSPEGQQTFTTALLQKATENSMDMKTGTMDVSKLGETLHNMGNTLQSINDPEIYQAVKGLQKTIANGDYLLKANNESTQLSGAVKTGGYALAGAAGAIGYGSGIYASMGTLLAAAGGTKVLSMMLTNPTVSRQLVRLGGGKLTDQAAKSTMKQIIGRALIPAAASNMAKKDIQNDKAQGRF